MVRVFIVEDHPIMRQALTALVNREVDFSVCGEAVTGEVALERIATVAPDVALLDVSLPGMTGLELIEHLVERYPNLPCMMLSGHGERAYIDQALAAGAQGYVIKGDVTEIIDGLRAVAAGRTYLSARCN